MKSVVQKTGRQDLQEKGAYLDMISMKEQLVYTAIFPED